MVLSVSLIIFAYYQKVFEFESLYYLFLQIIFFMGITASSLSLLLIPSAVIAERKHKTSHRIPAWVIIGLFILYLLTAVPGFSGAAGAFFSLANGGIQLVLFLSFMIVSLYSLVQFFLSWQTKSSYLKGVLLFCGAIVIVAIFVIDILYGLWSKLHYNRDLSIFYVLPVYTLIVSVLLTASVVKMTGNRMQRGINLTTLKTSGISQREEEVIRLLVDGKGYKDIAQELHISLATVQTHIKNIYRKTDVKSKVELINLLLNG